MKTKRRCPDCCRIVLTGGPGGGKTTAADLFRREIGNRVVIVPEAATLLFQGGFPRSPDTRARPVPSECKSIDTVPLMVRLNVHVLAEPTLTNTYGAENDPL